MVATAEWLGCRILAQRPDCEMLCTEDGVTCAIFDSLTRDWAHEARQKAKGAAERQSTPGVMNVGQNYNPI
jgi:hypothetical protein